MMHDGSRTTGGNMPVDLQQKVNILLNEFGVLVEGISRERQLRRAFVRSLLTCSLVVILDKNNLFIFAQSDFGMPSSRFIYVPEKQLISEQVLDSARWEFGFEDPFLIAFPSALLEQEEVQRQPVLKAIAVAHVDSEFQRVRKKMTSLIQINPLFGPAAYSVNEQLAFVLMPFTEELKEVYTSIIKPMIEATGLVCHRADDYKTNKAIMQDIWKAICEARVVIADLTGLNPNVMYELGIAHTVGKETVLIYQCDKGKDPNFPFDLSHIRRIDYENNITGGKKLETDLFDTLKSILKPVVLS